MGPAFLPAKAEASRDGWVGGWVGGMRGSAGTGRVSGDYFRLGELQVA